MKKYINSIPSSIITLLGSETMNISQNSVYNDPGYTISNSITVANEIIDAKLAAEKLYEVSVLVDQRFGHGTWQSILTERAKRIEEAKKAQKERIQVKRRQQEELKELATYFVIGLILIFIIVGGAVIYSILFRDDPLNLMK